MKKYYKNLSKKNTINIKTVSVENLNELKYDLLPHSFYRPDLVPFDFHLFPWLKIFPRKTTFPLFYNNIMTLQYR